jgi:hypothetical protein
MNEDEYINSITLEYLLNPGLYAKIVNPKNLSDKLIYKDITFYKRRISQITKDMCKGEYINENFKDMFLNYANTIIYYLKQTDKQDMLQLDYNDLSLNTIQGKDLSDPDNSDTDISNICFQANELLIHKPVQISNLDKFVKKINSESKAVTLPQQRTININDPSFKKKGVKKKILT